MTAHEFYTAHAQDGRAMLYVGSRTGRSGRPAKSAFGKNGQPASWLIQVNRQLVLVLDETFPAQRIVARDEKIEPHRKGGFRISRV